tara:strand:- start:255 stop:803 length:549 start_codon:yes stop_codon:yes gene_type:complete
MKNIEIDGLCFGTLISKEEISKKVKFLYDTLLINYKKKWPLCLVVLNGAAVFANELLQNIGSEVEISSLKVYSYKGLNSTNKITVDYIPYNLIKNRNILLIEDIVDSGLTLDFLKSELINHGANRVECVTLLFKPSKYQYEIKPNYIGFNIGDEFVVGYGMDFNEKGRSLKNIYKNTIHKIN